MPALERLIAYGSVVQKSPAHRSHELWQGELISALRLGDVERYPSSPLSWLGAGGARISGTWMHVDPVRMEMSADGLSLRPAAAWSTKQLEDLVQLFGAHLEPDFKVRSLNGGLFLCAAQEARVQSASVQYALTQPLRDVLPIGNDATSMRRLMTELQMLMYERFKEADAANAVWIWGVGSMMDPIQKPLPSLWSDEPFARGVYLVHEQDARCIALPNSISSIVEHDAAESVVVVRAQIKDSLDVRIFAPVLEALERGRFGAVDLFLDGNTIHVQRSYWRRIFARARPIAEVLK
jgi:hypothetical protein